jgi:predicted kinase
VTLKSANPINGKLPSPMLIMVMGLPGCGKTYFAKAFAKRIGGVHFNSDIIRKQRQQHTAYSSKNKSQVYQTMFQTVCLALEEKKVVIVDATFSLKKYRDPYLNYVEAHQIPLKVILVTADETTVFQRLQHPRPDSDADFEVHQKIAAEFETVDTDCLQLHSDQYPLDVLISQGIAYLEQP